MMHAVDYRYMVSQRCSPGQHCSAAPGAARHTHSPPHAAPANQVFRWRDAAAKLASGQRADVEAFAGLLRGSGPDARDTLDLLFDCAGLGQLLQEYASSQVGRTLPDVCAALPGGPV